MAQERRSVLVIGSAAVIKLFEVALAGIIRVETALDEAGQPHIGTALSKLASDPHIRSVFIVAHRALCHERRRLIELANQQKKRAVVFAPLEHHHDAEEVGASFLMPMFDRETIRGVATEVCRV